MGLGATLLFWRRKDVRKRRKTQIVEEVHEPERMLRELPYWVGPAPVMHLPTDLLVMQGGHRYGEDHPFILALRNGPEALSQFYRNFAPRTLAEMYGIEDLNDALGADLPPWELPWLLRDRKPPPGEAGLGPEHGVSYYGPCTEEKVDCELRRLRHLVDAIRADGYQPDKHGHIEGHFMKSGDRYRFFVRGGKHRTAALLFLGRDRIPVRMRDTWPRLVCRSHSSDWPLVAQGAMSRSVAEAVHERYFA